MSMASDSPRVHLHAFVTLARPTAVKRARRSLATILPSVSRPNSRLMRAVYKQQKISDEAACHEFVAARDRAATNV